MPSPRKKPNKDQQNPQCGHLSSSPPEWISDHGKMVWKETVDSLKSAKRPLLVIHQEAMIGFCSACSDLREAGEILAREGHLVDGGREGKKRHPAGSMRTQALNAVRAYAAELGLTPTSASRLPSVEKEESNNPFNDL